MKIHCPEYWFRDPRIDYGASEISMSAIVPQVGTRMSAGFARDAILRAGDEKTLLWKPPISDINGWSEQPSELAQSYLVGTRVLDVSGRTEHMPYLSDTYRHDFEILSCEPFLPMLRALGESEDSRGRARAGRGHPGSVVSPIWDDVHWCGYAHVDGLIYMLGNCYESHMELIAEDVDGELFVLYRWYADPGFEGRDVERHQLDQREKKMIRRAMQKAVPMKDTVAPYLTA